MNPLQAGSFISRSVEPFPPRRSQSCSGRLDRVSEEDPISSSVPLFVLQQKTTESISPPYQRLGCKQFFPMKNVCTQPFVQKHLTDPFVIKAFQKMECDLFTFERENLTHPEIAFPSKQALEMHIQAYREKYGISIKLGTLDQLPELLEEVRSSFLRPGYASFIIAQGPKELEDGHVLPLLVSFGGGDMECLLMDVYGARGQLVEVIRSLLGRFVSEDKIFIAAGGRQADGFSCRTGALSLLRNAHLSLRLHNFEEGLRDPLQALSGRFIDPENVLLPGEWTYVEQIFNGSENQMAVRDYFSKKIEKRTNPRTVKVFREQHTEQVRFCCTLINMKDYRADFQGLVPPEGMRVEIGKYRFCIVFETVVNINTYLVHKGFQRAGLKEREVLL